MLTDVTISSSYSAIDFPDIKFVSMHTLRDFLSMIPCMFYPGNVSDLAVAVYKNNAIDIIIPTGIVKPDISDAVKDTLRRYLIEGDRATFNYQTGDILIKNGDRQIKYFSATPVIRSPVSPSTSTQYGICYYLNGNDTIGYIYTGDAEVLHEMHVLSILCNKAFAISSDMDTTSFGFVVCAKLIEKVYNLPKSTYPKSINNFLCPNLAEYSKLEDGIFSALTKLKPDNLAAFLQDKVNETDKDDEEDTGNIIPFQSSINDKTINKLITTANGKTTFIRVPLKNPPYTQHHRTYLPLPTKIPLSEVLSHTVVVTVFPTELCIDTVLPSVIKRVNIISPTELEVCVYKLSDADSYPNLLEVFEGFATTIKEV